MACLIHDAGAAAGQGGFGAVWGSKNPKAVSVIGTGSITIADPDELLSSRLWASARRNHLTTRKPRRGPGSAWMARTR